MTQDEIIAMAKQAGFDEHHAKFDTRIETFANLVAEKEREACAELRNKFHPFDLKGRQEIIGVMNTALDDYQAAIRARGLE